MAPQLLHVPAIRLDAHGAPVVTRWGRVGAFTFRAGDRLRLGPVRPGQLALLLPGGFGWPMLGRCTERGLIAEPGAVPASSARWSAVGGLVGVERALDRCVVDPGRWWVAAGGEDAALVEAIGGPLQELDGDEVDALCGDLGRMGGRLRLGIAASPALAAALAAEASDGAAWLDAERPVQAAPLAELVEGPWPRLSAVGLAAAPRPGGVQLDLFRARRFGAAG
ncbi:MAG: hypothetical protein RL071_4085 [Pseudomonadota bacterium]|jgi:hypothetical protein